MSNEPQTAVFQFDYCARCRESLALPAAPAPVAGDVVDSANKVMKDEPNALQLQSLMAQGFDEKSARQFWAKLWLWADDALAQDRASQAGAAGVPELPAEIYEASGYASGAWSRRHWEAIQDDLRSLATAPTPAADTK